MQGLTKAVVLSCRGGSQGDLSVVRTLGREGVPVVVVSEYRDNPARSSRYTTRFHVCPELTRDDEKGLKFLLDLATAEPDPPVLFPTADPDLAMVDRLREPLKERYRLFISRPDLIAAFTDKGRFYDFATAKGFPIPHTIVPRDARDVRRVSESLRFPLIVKPLVPQDWTTPEIKRIVDDKKAVRVDSLAALERLYEAISPHNSRLLIQEYVHGRDDRLYSVHVCVGRAGTPLGVFSGQKIRTYPTYAGIGCFVRSVLVPELVELSLDLLQRVNYTGLALLQFKKDERTGQFKLLEINPRASSWNLLAYACGVNLPFLAYCDSVGRAAQPAPQQTEGRRYLFLEHDVRAFLDYRRHGDWTLFAWLRSLIGRNVYQYLAWDDLAPFLHSLRTHGRRAAKKIGLGSG